MFSAAFSLLHIDFLQREKGSGSSGEMGDQGVAT